MLQEITLESILTHLFALNKQIKYITIWSDRSLMGFIVKPTYHSYLGKGEWHTNCSTNLRIYLGKLPKSILLAGKTPYKDAIYMRKDYD